MMAVLMLSFFCNVAHADFITISSLDQDAIGALPQVNNVAGTGNAKIVFSFDSDIYGYVKESTTGSFWNQQTIYEYYYVHNFVIEMNDYAYQNFNGCIINQLNADGTLHTKYKWTRDVEYSGSELMWVKDANAKTVTVRTDSNGFQINSFTNNKVQIEFFLKSTADYGKAEFKIKGVIGSFGQTNTSGTKTTYTPSYASGLSGTTSSITYTDKDTYVLPTATRAIEYNIGAGCNNEPLSEVGFNADAATAYNLTFKPLGETDNLVSKYKIYARKFPDGKNPFRGTDTSGNPIDLYMYDASTMENSTEVAFVGEITPNGSEEYIYNLATGHGLSGNYYLVVCADVKSDVAEGKKIGVSIEKLNDTSFTSTTGTRTVMLNFQVVYRPFNGYSNFYRIPSIITASNGNLVTTSDGRKYENHDVRNDIDVMSRYSEDNGRTWSTPLIIAQGTGLTSIDDDCTSTAVVGYGDCALSQLPTPGHILAVFTSGDGLGSNSTTRTPTVYYEISTNNGMTWSKPKMIPVSVFNDPTGKQGCPGPGRMCLVKEGVLKDKVLLAAYTWDTGYVPSDINFLAYDEKNDTWTRVGGYNNSGNRIGESHFVEVGENKFILEARRDDGTSSTYPARQWWYCEVSESGTLTMKNQMSSTGDDFIPDMKCCGNIIPYKYNGETYLLQSQPLNVVSYVNTASTTRSNMYIGWTKFTSTEKLEWHATEEKMLSDGFATAGYSCLTVQEDGTIGLFMEAYPKAYYYVNCAEGRGGDALLSAIYQNLTLDWLTDGAVTSVPQTELEAPEVNPGNRSFQITKDTNGSVVSTEFEDDRAVKITVPTLPTQATGEVAYGVEYLVSKTSVDANGQAGASTTLQEATIVRASSWTESLTVPVDIKALLAGKVNRLDKVLVTARVVTLDANGNVVRRSLYSASTYTAVNPGRKVKLVVKMANEGALMSSEYYPSMVCDGIQLTGSPEGEMMTVGAGERLYLNAPVNARYSLMGFSLNGTTYENDQLSSTVDPWNAYILSDNSQHQVDVPTIDEYAGVTSDGINNMIVIYAWYKAEGGLYQRVSSTILVNENGAVKWNSEGNADLNPETMGTVELASLQINDPSTKANTVSESVVIKNSYSPYARIGVTVVPDINTMYNDAYIVIYDKAGNVVDYSKVNGIGVKNRAVEDVWYSTISDGVYMPSVYQTWMVIGSKLNNTLGTTVAQTGEVVTYVVNNDVEEVTKANLEKAAIYYVSQPISANKSVITGIEDASADEDDVVVTLLGDGQVNFKNFGETVDVTVCDMMGRTHTSFELEDEATITLPRGVYVALGKKFVIK